MGMTAGIALVAAGSVAGAVGAMDEGRARRELHRSNAALYEAKADDSLWRGGVMVERQREGTKKLLGSQRTAFAAAGVVSDDADSSAMNLYEDTAALSERDIMFIKSNAAREAWGFRVQAQNEREMGQIEYEAGENRAIGSILGGGAKMFGFGK